MCAHMHTLWCNWVNLPMIAQCRLGQFHWLQRLINNIMRREMEGGVGNSNGEYQLESDKVWGGGGAQAPT